MLALIQSTVKARIRLVIEYALVGAVIVLATTALAAWGGKKKTEVQLARAEVTLTTAQARVATLEEIGQRRAETIRELRALRENDSKVLASLIADFKDLTERVTAERAKLGELESGNESVKTYLANAVPLELDCMLRGASDCGTRTEDRDAH